MEKPRIRAASHSCLWFRAAVPVQHQRPSLSPEEQPPHRNQNVSPILIKKRPDPFLLDQAVFFFFCTATTAAEVLPSSPHFSPQHSGRLNRRRNSCRTASPPVESLRKGGGRGRKRLLQKGLPPPVSLLHLTSTRHLPSPYAAQANDILLISLGPLDGGRHDAEALKAETLLAKQQHFIHRLLA